MARIKGGFEMRRRMRWQLWALRWTLRLESLRRRLRKQQMRSLRRQCSQTKGWSRTQQLFWKEKDHHGPLALPEPQILLSDFRWRLFHPSELENAT
jgi:hypothetical protein